MSKIRTLAWSLIIIVASTPNIALSQSLPSDISSETDYEYRNPIAADNIAAALGQFGTVITGIVGSVAFALFVYAGFLWLTSAGNPNKVQQGKRIFVWTAVGLIIVFGAQALLAAVFSVLSQGSVN